MERKKQFQLQSLTSKLNTYENTLNELVEKRKIILASTLLIDTETNNDFKMKINNLLTRKTDIEKQITDTKTQITSNKYDITNITNQIKLLPTNLSQNIANETSIYNDEITNIENIITHTNIKHQEQLHTANIDHLTILTNINTIKEQLIQQNNTITELQFNAHHSRKTVLEELHQKKQQKIQIQQQIENISTQNTIYNQHLDKLTEINTILAQIKIEIINAHYEISNAIQNTIQNTNPKNTELLINLITKLNTYFETQENPISNIQIENLNQSAYIYNITTEIDNLIANNTARIDIIKLKATKARIKNDTHISLYIKQQIPNTARNKVISYKDQYKIEKGKRTELQNKLEELQYLYDNYEVIVINKFVAEYNNVILELDNHKQRANERLSIMKERLSLEHKENNTKLEKQIQTLQQNLITNNKLLLELNSQLNNINTNLAELDKSNLELHNLDNSITQLETTITKIKNDKTILEEHNN